MESLLVIEDDEALRELYVRTLRDEGFAVESAEDGKMAIALLGERRYALVVLDLMLPHTDGYAVLQFIRQLGDTPILIVSSKSDELDKIIGLRLGADDYLVKPFGLGEFAARAHALLRRALATGAGSGGVHSMRAAKLAWGGLALDPVSRTVAVNGDPKELTSTEFELLKLLLTEPGRVFTKDELFKAVWHQDYIADENTIMVHIRRLRAKIEPDASHPIYVRTVWGVGYKLGGAAP